jgi:PAS domain S-box-containing protein
MIASDGRLVWLHDVVTVESVDGKPKILRGFMLDITESKEKARALRRSERRFREVARSTTDLIYSWSPGDQRLHWYGDIDGCLKYKPGEFPRTMEATLTHVHPDDLGTVQKATAQHRKDGKPFLMEYRMRCKDGTYRYWQDRGKAVRDKAGLVYEIVGACSDITELKVVQKQIRRHTTELSRNQRTLSEAQRLAHIGSWEYDLRNNSVMVSDEYYRIFGIPQRSEVTAESFLARVHPDDVEYVKAEIAKGLSKHEPYTIDHRIVLPSGEVRFVQDETRIYFDEAGNAVRKMGTVHDVTDSKKAALKVQQAEEQMRALSRHLIQAQETERRRIALELHDQFSQDLALISIELEDLIQKTPEFPTQPMERLQRLAVQARKLSSQVQTLSHQLHPSQLTHLGLVAASRGLCSEVSKASGIRIDFGHSKVPNSIPQDVSVCLFRVLQESLGNIVRHSGAREAQVKLTGDCGEIQLHVSDSGVGFDPHSRQDSFGLGLIGMQERLLCTGGELVIDSQPRAGARIMARVPLTAASAQTKALQI